MGVAAAKAVKPANPSPHAAAEEEKEAVQPEKPKEPDVEYTMDSEPDLADEPDDDNLDMPNAADDPEKLAEPVAFRMLLHLSHLILHYFCTTPAPLLHNFCTTSTLWVL